MMLNRVMQLKQSTWVKLTFIFYRVTMHIQPSGFVLMLYVVTALMHYIPYSTCRGVLTIADILCIPHIFIVTTSKKLLYIIYIALDPRLCNHRSVEHHIYYLPS